MGQFMVTEEVSKLTRIPPESLRWMRHVGKGPKSFKLGRRCLYAVEDVEAWIDAARAEAVAP